MGMNSLPKLSIELTSKGIHPSTPVQNNAIIYPFVKFISIDSPDNISTFAPSKIE